MAPFLKDVSVQSVGTGLLAAVVGYTSSVAVVVHGLAAVGASNGQITSALIGLGVTMAVSALVLSLPSRMPISVAWSTPGMALLASIASLHGGYGAATGAFIAVGILVMIAGLWAPLGRLVASIPRPIASAMLGGILWTLVLAPFKAIGDTPGLAILLIVIWVVVGRFFRLWAAPAALIVALGAFAFGSTGMSSLSFQPHVEFVMPVFDWQAMVSVVLPVFIVTMASQNIPGLTVLATYGYHPKVRPVFLVTGLASSLGALIGAPVVNLAAITAALCAGPDAHPDPTRRYPAAIVAGLCYVAFAGIAAATTTLVTQASPVLIEAVAGLALIGAFGSAMLAAVQDEKERIPALVTFLVTASGVSAFGIGAAFWGLAAGVVVHVLYKVGRTAAT